MSEHVASSAAAPSTVDVFEPRPVELARNALAQRLGGGAQCLGCGKRTESRAELRHERTRGPAMCAALVTLVGFVLGGAIALRPFWNYLEAYQRFADHDTPPPEKVELGGMVFALALTVFVVGPLCALMLRTFEQRTGAVLCGVCDGHMRRARVLLQIAGIDVRLGVMMLGAALGLCLPFFEAAAFEGATRPLTRMVGVDRLIVSDGMHLITIFAFLGASLIAGGLAMAFHVRRRAWANVMRHELIDPFGEKHRVWIATRVR